MTVSVRSYLTAGMAAAVVGAVALTPVQPSTPTAMTAPTVRLAAAVEPLVSQVNTAGATLGQATPTAAVQQPQAQKTATANNNASDAIDWFYQNVVLYWGNYLALELGPYLLGWVPFGYLISDQIYIWYPSFTIPVANSFVYDFLDPVVNDFWNPAVWSAGLTAIAQTTFSSLGSVGTQEVAYLLSLQWFPIPLPPIPPLPFAALKTPAAAAGADPTTAAKTETTSAKSGVGHSGRLQVAKQTTDTTVTTDAVTDTTTVQDVSTPKAAAATKATTSTKANSSATSGKGGTAKSGTDTGKKKSTAGSARTKADKSAKGDS